MWSNTKSAYHSRETNLIPLAPLVLVIGILLAGCGDGADDPAPSPSPSAGTPEPPRIENNDVTTYFPRQPPGDHEYDDGAPVARLILDDAGCLRAGENGPVIIWPYSGFTVDLADGEVALVSKDTGNVIAHVGDEVSFHGSDPDFPMDTVPDHMLLRPLPEACADAEGYFITGPGIRSAD